jgi:hypothetical protein
MNKWIESNFNYTSPGFFRYCLVNPFTATVFLKSLEVMLMVLMSNTEEMYQENFGKSTDLDSVHVDMWRAIFVEITYRL